VWDGLKPNQAGNLATLIQVVVQIMEGKAMNQLTGIPEVNQAGFLLYVDDQHTIYLLKCTSNSLE
jgi:hypothetical protein